MMIIHKCMPCAAAYARRLQPVFPLRFGQVQDCPDLDKREFVQKYCLSLPKPEKNLPKCPL